jgi:D-threonate/D-erythronate kinase
MSPHLTIIADDLTGGLDTGVAFAARGWRTALRFPGARREASGVSKDSRPHACVVWDTETREVNEDTARRVVREACAEASASGTRRVYKKIDSTLRGPWLAELREVWKARAALTTVLCLAFPAVGRTVVDGEVRVHGRLLAEAGFSGTGRLRELLLERWCGRIVSLSTSQLRDAPLADPGREPWLLLADAETDADLDLLVRRLHEQGLDHLLCGAGGLAAAWARLLIPDPPPLPPLEPVAGLIWVLAGSQHPATRAQMEALSRMPGAHVEWFSAEDHDAARRLRELPAATVMGLGLAAGREGLATSFRDWATNFISAAGEAARERGVAAFVATGGETAALLLRALGVSALEIDRELLPGIPLCRMADGLCASTPLVTKAGGFGEPDALVGAISVVRTGHSRP